MLSPQKDEKEKRASGNFGRLRFTVLAMSAANNKSQLSSFDIFLTKCIGVLPLLFQPIR